MPEIKNTFTSGKMNKDLDERLVPKGEYIDALNIDISTSETSDVGAIENSFGNTLKSGNFINNASYIADAVCIGSIINKETNTIIWFIKGSNIDAIVEYDPDTEVTDPVLIDNFTNASLGNQKKFLNFSKKHLITGVNIIGDMLFWTDGNSEPKKINIANMKRGIDATQPWKKTNVLVKENGLISKGDSGTNNYVEEKHITVIRKAPFSAPKITLSDTERISEGADESTVHVPTNTTHASSPIDGGGGVEHDHIYSPSSGNQLIFNNDVQITTNRATATAGAFKNVVFVDVSTLSDSEWKQWLGVDNTRHLLHLTTAGTVRRYEIDKTHSTGGIDHVTGRIYLNCDSVATTISSGDVVVLKHYLEEFNNETFWTYKDSSGRTQKKPSGTNNQGRLQSDDTYLKDGGYLEDGSGKDFTPRLDLNDNNLIFTTAADNPTNQSNQQADSENTGWHKLAPVTNRSGSTPGYTDVYADASDAKIVYDATNMSDIEVGMVITSAVADVVNLNTRVVSVSGSSPKKIVLDKAVTNLFSTDSNAKTRVTFIMPNGLLMLAGAASLNNTEQRVYGVISEDSSGTDGLIPGHFYRLSMDVAVTANGGVGFPTTVSVRNNYGVGKDLRYTFTSGGNQPRKISGIFQYDPHMDFNNAGGTNGVWQQSEGRGVILTKDIDTIGTIKNIQIECISKPKPVRIQEVSFYGKPDYTVGDTVELTLSDNPLVSEQDVKIKLALTKQNLLAESVTAFPTYAAATTVGSELLNPDASTFTDASKWTIGNNGWTVSGGGTAVSNTGGSGTLDATTSASGGNGGLTTNLIAGNWYKLTYVISASANTNSDFALQINGQAYNIPDSTVNKTIHLLPDVATHVLYFRQGPNNLDRFRLYAAADPDVTLTDVSLKAVTMTGQVDFETTGSNESRKTFECEIVSASSNITQLMPSEAKKWAAIRVKKEALHQESFARFGYRWKYNDNQYSAMSPFTKVAFLPSSEYDYDTEEGYNKSMINDVRRIVLSDFEPAPENVNELDILYKSSESTNIYTLKTIKANNSPYSLGSPALSAEGPLEVSIISEMVHAVLPENQALRQYDNVPKSAKSQEITANRLLYGNYKQQYDLLEEPVIDSIVTSNDVIGGELPRQSVKSLRSYQVGVSLLDKYGRTTPVFSNDSLNVLNLGQELSSKANTIKAKITSLPPSFATHYKFYVKDPSAEYYNLAMDRFYQAEQSDQVWISFPSSDVNKVNKEDYLILKKSHDGSDDFQATAGKVFRYKVLAVETSAPQFVVNEKKLIGSASSCNFTTSGVNNSTGYPLRGRIMVRVNAARFTSSQAVLDMLPEATVGTRQVMSNTYIRVFSNLKGTASNFYEVESIEYNLANSINYYEFKLVDSFGTDVDFTGPAPGSTTRQLDLEIYKSNPNDYKAEFDGRFFVKIMKDFDFNNHILKSYLSPEGEYGIIASQNFQWLHHSITGQGTTDGYESDDLDYQKDTYVFGQSAQTLSLDTNIVGPIDITGFQGPDRSTRKDLAPIFPLSNQKWVIDSAFGWHQKPTNELSAARHEHANKDGNMGAEMGCGFLLGNKHADFRIIGLGPLNSDNEAPGDDQNKGYKFDRKSSVFKQFFENWPVYDKLRTAGTKFRWQNDPTRTIYNITSAEILDVNNYTNNDEDNSFHKRSNQGVRIHVQLDKPIAWTPTDPAAIIDESVLGDGVVSNPGDGYIKPLDNDLSTTGSHIASNSSKLEILYDLPTYNTFASNSPAIFELEPKERVDLNLYYETSEAILIPKTGMRITTDFIDDSTKASALLPTATITVNDVDNEQFIINHGSHNKVTGAYSSVKQTCNIPAGSKFSIHSLDDNRNVQHTRSFILPSALGKPGVIYAQLSRNITGQSEGPIVSINQSIKLPFHNLKYHNCFAFGNGVESNRVRDDFNANFIDKGPRVSSVIKIPYREEHKQNGIIYSGLYNYDSGVNRLNEFIQGEKITKFLNPDYGSIQKLFTRNTNVIAFCENKILKILANKDALFNADGNTNLTSTNNVLGQAIPFAGEYGISRNPESFASYGYRVYFTDKSRNAVLRLSGDGLTDISVYGMDGWFKDNLKPSSTIIGTYDEDKDNYNLTLNDYTLSYSESVRGWSSFKSFIPENGFSLKGYYYTFKNGNLWLHNLNENRNQFYGVEYDSKVRFLLNENPSDIKIFKTLNYEGSASQVYTSNSVSGEGWYASTIKTDKQFAEILEFKEKEGKWFNNIKGIDTTEDNIDLKELAVQGLGTVATVGSLPNPVYHLVRTTVTSTENDAAPPAKWRITNSLTDNSETASKIIEDFIASNTSTVTNQDFYIHGLSANGKQHVIDTINGGFVCTGSMTRTFADGYNNSGTWTVSSAHVGLATNIIRLRVSQTTTNPNTDVTQTLNVTGTAYLKQN